MFVNSKSRIAMMPIDVGLYMSQVITMRAKSTYSVTDKNSPQNCKYILFTLLQSRMSSV